MSITMSIKRYWPGKAPEWADDVEEADADFRMATYIVALDPKDGIENRPDDKDQVRSNHLPIRRAEILSAVHEEIRTLDDEDEALDDKRRAIKEKMLLKLKTETVLLPEEEESESETDSSDEKEMTAMVKQFFVPKSNRDTIAERERFEAQQRAFHEMVNKRKQDRKLETKKILVEEIRKDEQILRNMDHVEANNIVADDDEAKEYEAWKAREIDRIKRNRDAILLKEREQIDKLRKMTEEERKERDRNNPKPKKKLRFMQKYFHKGVFFQDKL